jgi:hypothetical protein
MVTIRKVKGRVSALVSFFFYFHNIMGN